MPIQNLILDKFFWACSEQISNFFHLFLVSYSQHAADSEYQFAYPQSLVYVEIYNQFYQEYYTALVISQPMALAINSSTINNKSHLRSQSMPLIVHPFKDSLKILKSKKSEKQIIELQKLKCRLVKLEIDEKKQQQIIAKNLFDRGLQKLQQRYETIDRWKQKYIPSNITLKSKVSEEREAQKLPSIHLNIQNSDWVSNKKANKNHPKIEKTLRFYQVKNSIIEKEINYFENASVIIPPDKKRQLELNKSFFNIQKTQNPGLSSKKLSIDFLDKQKLKHFLTQRNQKAQMGLKRVSNKLKSIESQKLGVQIEVMQKQKLNRIKQKWLKQLIQEVPIGWRIQDDLPNNNSVQQNDSNSYF